MERLKRNQQQLQPEGKGQPQSVKGHKPCSAKSPSPEGIPLPPVTALSACSETGPTLAPSGCQNPTGTEVP